MVTKETAKRITEICDEIEDCKQAIATLKGKQKCEEPVLHVLKDEKDEGIYLLISHLHAVKIIEQLQNTLEAEYADMNKEAIKEANQ